MESAKGAISKQSLAYTAVIAACLLLISTVVWIQGQRIPSLQKQIDALSVNTSSTDTPVDLNASVTSTDLSKIIFLNKSDAYFEINQKVVNVALGVFTVKHWCKGEALNVRNYSICIGTNRLTIRLKRLDGSETEDYLIRESEGLKLPDSSYLSYPIFDAPSLLNVAVVPFDPKLYPAGYLPNDFIVSYSVSPIVNGGEGVATVYEPVTDLVLGVRFQGKGNVRQLENFPELRNIVFGPVGQGIYFDEPVCSGARCQAGPEPLRLYNVYRDSSTFVGSTKATFSGDDRLGSEEAASFSVWSAYRWKSLHAIEAEVIRPDQTTTTVVIPVR